MPYKSDSGSEEAGPSSGRAPCGEQFDDDICRDYMRNVCTRGRRCRYRHPTCEERAEPPSRRDLTFCHDYQNNGCSRQSCKFLHCSRDEEEHFHRTGLLPSRLNSSPQASSSSAKSGVPLCRDFQNGDCKRGSKCKYKHELDHSLSDQDRRSERSQDLQPEVKRRRVDDYELLRVGLGYSILEDEIFMLKRKVDELKKQVTDLTAINEVLLDQNARYRVCKAAAALHAPNSQHTLSAMAITAVTPAHTGLTQLTQQIALNSDLATQHALAAQRLAAAAAAAGGGLAQPRQAQGAMAVSPTVTLTQNIAGALALTPSSLPGSMASMPVAHSLTQSLGAPSTTLVSYPIMSHNMRSALEASCLSR